MLAKFDVLKINSFVQINTLMNNLI